MDVATVFGGINITLIIALYLYIQSREDKTAERIAKNEVKVNEVETNYNAKFLGVHDAMHKTELSIISVVNTLENNMRESNHTLREEVTKSMNRLEMIIKDK